jgi:anthranilate synthase component 1
VIEAGFEDFATGLAAGRPQVVVRRLVDDLETPVSAYLKVGLGRTHAFLLESVEGGALNGRYSIITVEPDVVWRCRGGAAEIARGPDVAADRFSPEPLPALAVPARPDRRDEVRPDRHALRRVAAHGRRPVRRLRL